MLFRSDVLQSEPYLALKRHENAQPATSFEARTLQFPGFVRGVYRQVFPDTPYAMPDSEVLFLVAHDIPPQREEEFTAWYNTEHVPAMLGVPGFLTAEDETSSIPTLHRSIASPATPCFKAFSANVPSRGSIARQIGSKAGLISASTLPARLVIA